MDRFDPAYQDFLAQQGFMQRTPLSDIPGRPFAPKQPMPPSPPPQHQMPDGAMMAGATHGGGGAGLPRQITRPKNADLFGSYSATYQASRPQPQAQAGGGLLAPAEEAPPRYLSNSGQTSPGGMVGGLMGAGQAQQVDPQEAEMARRFPRAYALHQKITQQRQAQQAQEMAASVMPQMEADMAQRKADTEISLMEQKANLEGRAMQQKYAQNEMTMEQKMRQAQQQQQIAAMQPQPTRRPGGGSMTY